ncbi:MAG: VWA domain-containing protein, partial [Oscillibacter sp.]|nr:VWA domain-containing protein [Oscillibacter sp.]
MAKTKTRVLSLVMALVLAFSLLPISAFAYTLDDAVADQKNAQITAAGGKKYYKADGTETDAAGADVIVSKELTATGTENLFDVTTNVQYKGVTTNTTNNDAAVVLVIDTSGSMGYNSGHDGSKDNPKLGKAKTAAKDFLAQFAKDGEAFSTKKRMVALVTFSKFASSHDMDSAVSGTQYWIDVNSQEKLKEAQDVIDGLGADGGTNTEAGLVLANNLLTSSNSAITNALSGIDKTRQCTILLTDGQPTYHVRDYTYEDRYWPYAEHTEPANVSSLDIVPSQDMYSKHEYKFIGGNGNSTGTDETYPVQTAC